MRFEAKCDHIPRSRGSKYWFWARRTCKRPSLVVAWSAKISKIKAVRSMTFKSRSTDFSRFDCCDGVNSSSKMIKSAPVDRQRREISSTLPLPTKVLGFGESSFCVVTATVSAPAVSANRSSSAKEDEIFQRMPGRSTPTSTAFSRFSSTVVFAPLIKTDWYSDIGNPLRWVQAEMRT